MLYNVQQYFDHSWLVSQSVYPMIFGSIFDGRSSVFDGDTTIDHRPSSTSSYVKEIKMYFRCLVHIRTDTCYLYNGCTMDYCLLPRSLNR